MARGWAAAAEAARDLDDPDPETVCKTVGKTLMAEVGGARGPLFGGSLVFASAELDEGLTAESAVAFAETYLTKVEERGDARVGDQTIVDALTPTVHTFKKSIETDDLPPLEALAKAVDAAERGAASRLRSRSGPGRAAPPYLGWRSVGHQDPGATSALYILEEVLATAADALDTEIPDVDATSPTIPDEAAEDDSARRRRTTDGRTRRRLPQRAGGRGESSRSPPRWPATPGSSRSAATDRAGSVPSRTRSKTRSTPPTTARGRRPRRSG